MHTQGPWRAEDGYIHAPSRGLIAAVRFLGGDNQEGRDNARLIAAAPDMLHILKQIASLGEDVIGHDMLVEVDAAIDKATGK